MSNTFTYTTLFRSRLVYPGLVEGLNRTKDKLCHSDKRRNLRKNKRRFGLFTLGLSKGSIGQKKAMSFRQKEESQKKQEMFQLVYPRLVEGLNRTKEGYVIPTKGGISEKTRDVSTCLPCACRRAQHDRRGLCHSSKRRHLNKTKRCFSLFTLCLSKGSIGQKKAMSFRQKEESQIKQEMFQLVYPELVEGLNRTKEGYVI